MNAKLLRAYLQNIPDDTPVVVPAPDHHYRHPYLAIQRGMYEGREIVDDDLQGGPTVYILVIE